MVLKISSRNTKWCSGKEIVLLFVVCTWCIISIPAWMLHILVLHSAQEKEKKINIHNWYTHIIAAWLCTHSACLFTFVHVWSLSGEKSEEKEETDEPSQEGEKEEASQPPESQKGTHAALFAPTHKQCIRLNSDLYLLEQIQIQKLFNMTFWNPWLSLCNQEFKLK